MKYFLYALLSAASILCLASCDNGRTQKNSNPDSPTEATETVVEIIEQTSNTDNHPTYNVYIENSGSMYGFFQGETELENALYRYLTEIEVNRLTDKLNFFYINSEIIPHDVESPDFIPLLTPESFRRAGGEMGDTDIAEVLKMIIDNTNNDEVAIMVTDGIISPGAHVDANTYLKTQETEIYRFFSDYRHKEPEAGAILFQLSSNFNGIFYNKVNRKSSINHEILYYIWIIGKQKDLVELENKVGDGDLRNHSANNWLNKFIIASGDQKVHYRLSDNIGNYKRSKTNTSKTIGKMRKDKKTGLAEFGINVDFSSLLIDEEYIMNPDNYELNFDYDLKISRSANKRDHILRFSANRPIRGKFNIRLKTSDDLPGWVLTSNDAEGEKAIPNQTYGIKYQVNGLRDAFTKSTSYYTEMTIEIN